MFFHQWFCSDSPKINRGYLRIRSASFELSLGISLSFDTEMDVEYLTVTKARTV